MNEKVLYLVRGLPGSGKSTFAKKLVHSDFLVCEADKYFMVNGEYKFDVKGSKHSLFPKICEVEAVGIGATNKEFLIPPLH